MKFEQSAVVPVAFYGFVGQNRKFGIGTLTGKFK